MRTLLLGLILLTASPALALADHCSPYAKHPRYQEAIALIAGKMGYEPKELCGLDRLAAIYVTDRVFFNKENQPEPHIWVTLHYMEYSCQYFVREADSVVTRKNCYNTW
jgi:hypothetical protein